MGYDTHLEGQFKLNKELSSAHSAYLHLFASTRRMKREPSKTELRNDPTRMNAEIQSIGKDAGYFTGAGDFCGQEHTDDIIDYNEPPDEQPSLWCRWVPSDDNLAIQWDGGEKFACYIEWIEYLIVHFLTPWGYELNGIVKWEGEEQGDVGKIIIEQNKVTIKEGRIVYS